MKAGSNKAVIAALLANLGIAVAKFVGFAFTRSASMLAEAIHSVADSGNQALLLFGGKQAQRRATPQHPFGYGRERFFWAFVVAVVLFTLGSLFSLSEGIQKLRHPHEPQFLIVAVGILSAAIVMESLSFRTAIIESNHVRRGDSWWSFIRHARVPELPVVLLEDLGALVGMLLALAGVGLTRLTGNANWDAYATIAIGVLLGVIAIVLCVEMKSLLIGESAVARDAEAIRTALEGCPGIHRFIHMRTQHLGPDELLVGAKIEFEPQLTAAEVARAIEDAEHRVRQRVPSARVIYLEPGIFSASTPAT
jgi:cation diffusion facilitator family transporter